jgi:hypothetical protein
MKKINHPVLEQDVTTVPPGAGGYGLRQAALMSLALLLLSACATSPAARDKLVQQRAEARWAALLARDYAKAYGYASPGYRSGASVVDFEIEFRSRRVQYTSAEYRGHSCAEAACTVEMRVGYRVVRPAPGVPEWESSSVIEERWINTGGNWWFVPESR